jgi:hypothetical protein
MGVDAEMFALVEGEVPNEAVAVWDQILKQKFAPDRELRWNWYGAAVTNSDYEWGAELPGEVGHTIIKIGMDAMRYYGRGYERGDIEHIIEIAEFVEQLIPGAKIFYGSDCGEFPETFGAEERAAILEYKRGPNGDNYHKRSEAWNAQHGIKT